MLLMKTEPVFFLNLKSIVLPSKFSSLHTNIGTLRIKYFVSTVFQFVFHHILPNKCTDFFKCTLSI